MRRVFVRFLEEIEDSKEAFRNYLTFSKGQLISKGVLMSSISSKNRMKEFDFTTTVCLIWKRVILNGSEGLKGW